MNDYKYHLKDDSLGLRFEIYKGSSLLSQKEALCQSQQGADTCLPLLMTALNSLDYIYERKCWSIPKSKIKAFFDKCALIQPLFFNSTSILMDRINDWVLSIDILVDGEEGVISSIAKSPGASIELSSGHVVYGNPCYLIGGGFCRKLPEGCDATVIGLLQEGKIIPELIEELQDLDDEHGIDIDLNGLEWKSFAQFFEVKPSPQIHITDAKSGAIELFFKYENELISAFDQRDKILVNGSKISRNKHLEKEFTKCLEKKGFKLFASQGADYLCPVADLYKNLDALVSDGWEILFEDGNLKILRDNECFIKEEDASLAIYLDSDKSHFITLSNDNQLYRPLLSQGNQSYLLPDSLYATIKCWQKTAHGDKKLSTLDVVFNPELRKIQREGDFDHIQALLKLDLKHLSIPQMTDFKGTLRTYQKEGVAWLSCLHDHNLGGLLCDDMGLGKTVQVIAFLSSLNLDRRALVVLPKSLLFNWKHQLEEFAPMLSTQVMWGENLNFESNLHSQIWLTTFSTFLNYKDAFVSEAYETIIIDESQLIKRSQTQAFQELYKVDARSRFCLSATPMENSPQELLNLLQFVLPSYPINQGAREDLKPFILRRTKQGVASELPSREVVTRYIEPYDEEKSFYSRYLSQIKEDQAHVFEQLTRLRQIACMPSQVPSINGVNPPGKCAKIDYAVEKIQIALSEGLSIILFSQFLDVLSLIYKSLKDLGLNPLILTGETEDRKSIVDAFQEREGPQVLLASLKAGGSGLNLTRADIVIIYDPWWNESVEEQAIDRAHRIGRKNPVLAEKLVAVGTVEERMLEVKEIKQKAIDNVYKSLKDLDTGALSILLT